MRYAHSHYAPLHIVRQDNANIDKTLRNIAGMFATRQIDIRTALEMAREAGACEPEIREALS